MEMSCLAKGCHDISFLDLWTNHLIRTESSHSMLAWHERSGGPRLQESCDWMGAERAGKRYAGRYLALRSLVRRDVGHVAWSDEREDKGWA